MDYQIDRAVEVLQRTPRILRAWLEDLSDDWALASEGEGIWSAFDVVGHLIHGERTDWMVRARQILDPASDGRFAPFDRFAQERESEGKTMNELLEEFSALRERNVADLAALDVTAEQLEATGIHPDFGEVTLRQLLATWVAHDLDHLAQMARVMAKQYRDEVGPWSEFLRVLA